MLISIRESGVVILNILCHHDISSQPINRKISHIKRNKKPNKKFLVFKNLIEMRNQIKEAIIINPN